MKKRMITAIAALVLVFGGIFGWKALQGYFMGQYFASFQPPPVTVSTGEVTVESWQPQLRAIGSLRAIQGVDVTAEVPGMVAEILFASGEAVEHGAPLVQLDAATDRSELPGLRARFDLAEQNLRRTREIVQQKLASQEALDTAQSEYDQAKSALESREVLIAKKTIRAPFAGRLGIRQVDVGQYVQPGSPIVTLQALESLYVDFTLPQQQLGEIAPGQPLRLFSDAWPDESFTGRIIAISPKVDASSRNFAAQGEVVNTDGRLRPGMFVELLVVTGEPQERITVPRTAVTYSLYGDSVFVVDAGAEQPVAQERFVRTGEERDGRVAILEGVTAGDTVVTAGQIKLQDGAHVTIDNDVDLQQGADAPAENAAVATTSTDVERRN